MPSNDLPDHHAEFLNWAYEKGVRQHSVKPAVLQGSGVGIVATRDIKEGETIMHIPRSAMLALVDPDRPLYAPDQPQLSIHGRLARRFLPLHMKSRNIDEKVEGYAQDDLELWRQAMPSQEDVENDMPLLWDERLQRQLPVRAQEMLEKQQTKFRADLAAITEVEFKHLEDVNRGTTRTPDVQTCVDAFTHMWMLVNSRCFYWDYPDLAISPPTSIPNKRVNKSKRTSKAKKDERDRDDCMALCPVIDYFNHGDVEDSLQCAVSFSTTGYTVTTLHDIASGSEIHVSYGQHSNDFLLVEYGFLLAENSADSTTLDTHILLALSESQKEALKDRNLLGQYTLDRQGVCWRTQCALSALALDEARWLSYVDWGGEDPDNTLGEDEKRRLQESCERVLRAQGDECANVLTALSVMKHPRVKAANAKAALNARWTQIETMVDAELERRRS